jgi:hypothetical protein
MNIATMKRSVAAGSISLLGALGLAAADYPVVYGASPPIARQYQAQTAQVTPVVYRVRPARHRRRARVYYKRRKFSHSAAIVGGSAAGGAAVGALAGGGKGAAIGALAGGGAGLVYDRATHKKRVVVR